MPVDLTVDDVVAVKAVCLFGSQQGVNVWHYLITGLTGGAPTPTCAELAESISGVWSSEYRDALTQQATFFGIGVQVVRPAPLTEEGWAGDAGVGFQAGSSMPGQLSGIVSIVTSGTGPSQRGRKFIPFCNVANSDADGRPTAVYKGLLQAVGDVYVNTASYDVGGARTVEVSPVILHADGSVDLVIGASARSYWSWLRSRSPDAPSNPPPPWPF